MARSGVRPSDTALPSCPYERKFKVEVLASVCVRCMCDFSAEALHCSKALAQGGNLRLILAGDWLAGSVADIETKFLKTCLAKVTDGRIRKTECG